MYLVSQGAPVNLFDAVMAQRTAPVAYLHKVRGGHELTIVARPCNGAEFQAGEKIAVEGVRDARRICAERGATPHNF